jgi:hypothetical protein
MNRTEQNISFIFTQAFFNTIWGHNTILYNRECIVPVRTKEVYNHLTKYIANEEKKHKHTKTLLN